MKEKFEKTEKLYHFTSFDTALKIIESNRLRFGRLNNMNDIHENDKILLPCLAEMTRIIRIRNYPGAPFEGRLSKSFTHGSLLRQNAKLFATFCAIVAKSTDHSP